MKNSAKKVKVFWGLAIAGILLISGGCARVGYEFNSEQVRQIKIGETTQNDIVSMFGQPWRKGIENGVTMWTYGRYTYRLVGEADTKDLVVKFNSEGKVISYTFNATAQ
ncbi:MAG: outer membrane protein assembly factor BamE [Sulfurimonas sp.]|uniref:outer membrane protein assembly factor BamE domain-containing protein n=1 Tax=Sulfurimonas sp. TaxID=2022749 RepID=UPI002608EFC7|nr:outer membrane protein assembly factor BamE [Sulfurimonas sp.]MDD5372932.1 outer membrane protein assembly factor BamE [Sulfurimonas sp.]